MLSLRSKNATGVNRSNKNSCGCNRKGYRNMLTAIVAKVQIGTIEIDGLMDAEGNYYVAMPQLTDMNIVPPGRSAKQLQDIFQLDYNPFVKIKTPLSSKAVNAIPINSLETILNALVYKGSHQALSILNKVNPSKKLKVKSKLTRKYIEQKVKSKLLLKLKGIQEVITPVGRIDILTETELIEVKEFKDWKSAIGQVLVYGEYYPQHKKRIHFFGNTNKSYYDIIKKHCDKMQISITVDKLSTVIDD